MLLLVEEEQKGTGRLQQGRRVHRSLIGKSERVRENIVNLDDVCRSEAEGEYQRQHIIIKEKLEM